ITKAVADIQNAGAVHAQDFLQLTSAGIPAWAALAEYIGKSVMETKKLAELGQIDSTTGIQALLKLAESPKFVGTMARMSQTITGLLSTLGDAWDSFKAGIGGTIVEAFGIRGTITQLGTLIDTLGVAFDYLEPAITRVGAVWKAFADVAIIGVT